MPSCRRGFTPRFWTREGNAVFDRGIKLPPTAALLLVAGKTRFAVETECSRLSCNRLRWSGPVKSHGSVVSGGMRLIPDRLAGFGWRGLRGVFMRRSTRGVGGLSLKCRNRFNRVGLWCWGGDFRKMFRARFCFDRRALVLNALGGCGVGFDRWVTWLLRRCGG